MARLLHRNSPRSLSPAWEAFITAVWLPFAQWHVTNCTQDCLHSEEDRYALAEGSRLHCFNMANTAVNLHRGRYFLRTLEELRARMRAGRAWWPQEAEGIVAIVKREREEVDTLGYIVGVKQVMAAHASAASSSQKAKLSGASTAPILERKPSDLTSASP